MTYSYLGKDELAYLTEKLIIAAQKTKEKEKKSARQAEFMKRLILLQDRLALLDPSDEKVSRLRERLYKLNEAIKTL